MATAGNPFQQAFDNTITYMKTLGELWKAEGEAAKSFADAEKVRAEAALEWQKALLEAEKVSQNHQLTVQFKAELIELRKKSTRIRSETPSQEVHLRNLQFFTQGDMLDADMVPGVWESEAFVRGKLPDDKQQELDVQTIISDWHDPKYYSWNRHPEKPCDPVDNDVDSISQLLTWLEKKKFYMPKKDRAPYRAIRTVFNSLIAFADAGPAKKAEALAEESTKLMDKWSKILFPGTAPGGN